MQLPKGYVILLLLVLLVLPCFSQDSNQTKYSLSFAGGITIPTGDLKEGSVRKIFLTNKFDEGYAMSDAGFGIGGIFRYSWPRKPLRISFGIQLNYFHVDTTILIGGILGTPTTERTGELRGQVITFKTALYFTVIHSNKTNLMISLAPEFNLISGHSVIDGRTAVELERSSRFGLGAGMVFNYGLSKIYFIEVPIEYHFANLIGKQYIENPNEKIPLNDGGSSDNSMESKSITYLSILIQFGINI